MDWLTLSALLLVVGMAGFWGGVLQHAHANSGDGGTLSGYGRVLFRSVAQTFIFNSTVETVLATYTLPGGTMSSGQVLRITTLLRWDQITGVAQNEPSIRVGTNGSSVCGHTGNSTPFASAAGPRTFQMVTILSVRGTTLNANGWYVWNDTTSFAPGLTPVIQKYFMGLGTLLNPAVDNTIEIRAANPIANASYGVQHESTVIELL